MLHVRYALVLQPETIFDRDWTSDTTIGMILDVVYGLLLQPDTSDPVNVSSTLDYHHDAVEYAQEVRDHVERYAWKTREEWKAELLGFDDDDEDEEEDDEDGDEEDDEEDNEEGNWEDDEEMSDACVSSEPGDH
ncbi:hypothetical protein LTR36_010908 [Oleoguttula mirabilis]|uniref:Uncharacterized protein n=1 Tax=Oleoguttula mirabilis TaxID=1507867 RepID=A0AAV9J416_9PEZI|nr:hypothetical protein LTR36_010908 [Oleoguttula mirabilis]